MIDYKQLPVYQNRQEILDALSKNQVIVVQSPTGSGKTTQMPIILHEAGYADEKMIGITQPRRIATLSVCDFIKRQLNDRENFIAYKMRFEDTTDYTTRIKVMTDGILLMELKNDPMLMQYSVILVDEAHERSLNIDFILGLLKRIVAQRPEFKVIISSATINTRVFSRFFDNCPIVSIHSRVYPVHVIYSPAHRQTFDDQLEMIISIVKRESKKQAGDILIFLSGEFEIVTTVNALYAADPKEELEIYPLYGRLGKEEQERVFTPTSKGKTKVVVSTNIAETSVTIDGITVVIDLGVAKLNFYNQKDFTSSLVPLPTSRSSCEQRSGRAGRTQAGTCYRLFTKEDYQSRPAYQIEEILRTDLSEVVLRMSDLGIYDYEQFSFITRPKAQALKSAEETLRYIGAIDRNRMLTSIGSLMVRFPLLPRHSRVVVEAMMTYPDVLDEVLIAIAFLSTKTPFLFPAGEEDASRAAHRSFNTSAYGDFVMYLNLFRQYANLAKQKQRQDFCTKYYLDHQGMQEIVHVHEQLGEICSEIGFPLSSGGSVREYLSCIAKGLSQYICIRARGTMYKSLSVDQIYIHPGSAWFKTLPRFIIAGEIVQTSRLYARSVSPLEQEWLEDIQPGLSKKLMAFDSKQKGKEEEHEEKSFRKRDQQRGTAGFDLYGKRYPTIKARTKKQQEVVIIPLDDLPSIVKANDRSPQRPKNFRAALAYRGFYVHYNDKFFSLLELNGKLKPELGILDNPPSGVFTIDSARLLIDNLRWLLGFTKSKKNREILGFITLEASGSGNYRFSNNPDFFDALDTSLFHLLHLEDELRDSDRKKEAKEVSSIYTKLLTLAQ